MSPSPAFLVADDDPAIRKLLKWTLETRFPGSAVTTVAAGDDVLELASGLRPQVIFVDWVMGHGRTGPEVCALLKAHPRTRHIPVVVMTGLRKNLGDRAKSLEKGVDLFLAKPFTVDEVAGYTRALLRRAEPPGRAVLRLGPLQLERETRNLLWEARPLPALSRVLFELLWLLAQHSPEPVSPEELVRLVWKRPVRDGYVRMALDRLRRHLDPARGVSIENVPSKGYRLTVS